jgi:electron transfer flavoprotein alpha subunit
MSILVIAEQVDGVFRKVSFEALSAARELGGEVKCRRIGQRISGGPRRTRAIRRRNNLRGR